MTKPSPFSRAFGKRLSIAAIAAVPVLAFVVQPTANAMPERPSVPENNSSTHKVTLVTGDVVTVTTMADGRQLADVDRPVDAQGGVRVQQSGGDLYVVPDEAVALLGANKLDPRLFDVTDLIEMGYDDAGRRTLPMIASYQHGKGRASQTPAAPRGSRITRDLASIDGAALVTAKPRARTFWNSIAPELDLTDPTPSLEGGLSKLWLDGQVQVNLKDSVPQIGAPAAWAAGYDGTGVKVAVLDTGVDANHPDLAPQIEDTESFVPEESVADINGHGTHVASTIAGTGAASDGDYKGVAPGADLIIGKVLGGAAGEGQDSWVLAGMEWAAESGAKVVNMSLGDSMPADGTDPLSQAVDSLSDEYGTLFVIAAGNYGPETISSPGAAAKALTVGAVDKQDVLAGFSATGPITKTGALKPDIVAPGVDITAARSEDIPEASTEMYQTLSGTSMATPHVAGSAAILAQRHPGWTGEQLKEQLMSSSNGLGNNYSPYDVGAGRVDIAAAVSATARATGSLFFGNFTWPHEPTDAAVTKDLTFTNDGDADLSLDLTQTATDGAFSLSADSVTVPAGGTAKVQVTGDPQAVDVGRFVGYVIGTDHATGNAVTRTSLGMIKEDERYDLNLSLVDRNGHPASGWVSFNEAGSPWPWAEFIEGGRTLRMPPGDYSVVTYMDVNGEGPDRSGVAALLDPEVLLHQDTDVVLDARDARLLQTTAPKANTEDRQRKVDFAVTDEYGLEFRSAYAVESKVDDVYVSPTEPVTDGSFLLTTRWRKGEPMLGLTTADGATRFTTVTQPGSAVGSTTDTAATVYAGNGAPADYAGLDVEGKIVVVEHSDSVTPEQRAQNAASAGALALVVVNDGIGGLNEYVGTSMIPVAAVHRDEGADLITMAKAGDELTLKQAKYTKYVFDLTREYKGNVPDEPLVYEPTKADLAKIDSHYYAVKPGDAMGYRYDVSFTPALGFDEAENHPGTRVEWVTPGQEWVESHAQNIYGALPWPMVSGVNTYAKGTTTRQDWFRPATRPGFSDSFGVYNSRWGNYMIWNVQDWSSSSSTQRLGGYMPWGMTPTDMKLWQGNHLIKHNIYSSDAQWVEVPAGNKQFRVVLDAKRPGNVFRLSTHTHTEWKFMSKSVSGDYFKSFPVMKLDYKLATDLSGDVKAGERQYIALRSASSNFQKLPGKVTGVTLSVSYDGGDTWHKLTVRKGADNWQHGSFQSPKNAKGFVSLRATATMDSGYSIKQTIIRAYGLR